MNLLGRSLLTSLVLSLLTGTGFSNRIQNFPQTIVAPQLSLLADLKERLGPLGDGFFSRNEFRGLQLNPAESIRTQEVELLAKALVPSYVTDWVKGQRDLNQIGNGTITLPKLPITDSCQKHVQVFVDELVSIVFEPSRILNASTWALQMIDSWGKLPEGILSGHINTYGDWDECVNVESPNKSDFKGKYCWNYLVPTAGLLSGTGKADSDENLQLKAASGSIPDLINSMLRYTAALMIPSYSTCVPSSCTTEDVQVLAILLFSDLENPENRAFFPFVSFCNELEKPPFNSGAIAMISVLSVLGFLILVGTVLDTVLRLKSVTEEFRKNIVVRVILSFSLVTNVIKWQNTGSGGEFGCIHGIRFFSTCWVLLCHTLVMFSMQSPSWNNIEINQIYKRHWSMYVILNGFFSVDTFFTMSGLLACLSILKALDKTGGRLNPLKLYIHRYMRITPTYALIIGLIATLFSYLGDGPYFSMMAEILSKNCQKFWWHNLLYAQNLITYNATAGDASCEGESWYIANDMQFFVLAPMFVFLLWKWQYVGMTVLGAASLASILAPGIAVGTEKLPPTNILWKTNGSDRPRQLYHHPWFRIGPYLVGMWMGYFLFKLGKKPVKLPKIVVILGWTLSTATALALIFGISPYYDPDNDDNAVGAGFYAGLSRFTWGIVISWIIFACVKGYGGVVNSFLSWKVFVPLGRLTFCVYLSSMSVQMLLHLTLRQPMYFDMYTITNLFFSHVVMCFLVGFGLTMAFESPFIQLEKLIFGAGDGGSKGKGTRVLENDQAKVDQDNKSS